MAFTSLKVFGERNTGTNFLNSFLRSNTSLKVLSGGDGHRVQLKQECQSFIDVHGITDLLTQQLIKESLLDQNSLCRRQKNFGWKHAKVCPDSLSKITNFKDVVFVFIIRNPWKFINSLHQKPYNLLPRPAADLTLFVQSPIYANLRDQLSTRLINSPVELWNQKVKSYFKFVEAYPRQSLIVFYEDLILFPDQFAKRLSYFCKVSEHIVVPQDSTKKHRGDSKEYTEFCQEVLNYDPKKALGKTIFSLVKDRLDCNLLAKTPYSKYLG